MYNTKKINFQHPTFNVNPLQGKFNITIYSYNTITATRNYLLFNTRLKPGAVFFAYSLQPIYTNNTF